MIANKLEIKLCFNDMVMLMKIVNYHLLLLN